MPGIDGFTLLVAPWVVRTTLLRNKAAKEKIIPLNSPVIVVNNSAQKISSIISRSWNPLHFQLDVVKQAHRGVIKHLCVNS